MRMELKDILGETFMRIGWKEILRETFMRIGWKDILRETFMRVWVEIYFSMFSLIYTHTQLS
jgi:hypothetical protein